MKDLMGLMKQAQEMQKKVQDAQAQMDHVEVIGESGAGAVKITLTAKGEARSISIDPSLINPDEAEILEDLLLAAMNDGRRKAEDQAKALMQEAASGLQLPPGMPSPF